jgi:integrase
MWVHIGLKMLHGHYLQRHRNRYRFRMRYPKGLVAFDFSGELIVALRTDSFSLALKRARHLRVAVESLMIDLAGTMNRAEADQMVRGWVDRSTRQWEANMALSGGFAFFDRDEVEIMGEENAREMDDLMRVLGETMVRPRIKAAMSAELSGRGGHGMEGLRPVVGAAVAEYAPQVDPASLDGKLVGRAFVRGLATIMDEQSAIERGEVTPIPRATASMASPPPAPVKVDLGFRFLAHWDAFEASKIQEGEWKSDTGTNSRSTRNLFESLFPEMEVSAISRETAAELRTLLFGLPSKYDKEKRWRGVPLRQVIATAPGIVKQAETSGDVAPVKFMKVPTINKHFSNLVEYWNWLQKTGKVGADTANPFTGFILAKPKGKRARHERDAWPQDMLSLLFGSPVWTGCSSLSRRSKPGLNIYRDARFWVPLIGRMIGAREDEICSLNVGDIQFIDGIAAFHIADSKTDGSERDVPLPELLLIMGFLEHRFYGRDLDEPLFPELLPQGVEGRRSASFSSWFTEYRRAVECYRLLVDFHSFRHNVSTDLENMPGLNLGWADEITGHVSDIRASERSRYAKGVYMRHLKDTLDRINLGVNLDHLAYDGDYGVAAPTAAADIATFTVRAVRDMAVKAGRRKARPVA